jgi:small conductance mechanosensitive channel
MDWDAFLHFLLEMVTSFGLKLIGALVVLVVGLKLIKWIRKFLLNSNKLSKLDDGIRTFMASFAGIALYILLFITVAMVLGVPTTSFITVLASCGVAIGLALQGSLSNFAGGIMILLFKPFKVGDYIEAAGEAGTVTEISVVYTILLTPDNKRITIPNGSITNSVIENYSAEPLRRVDFTFSTAYDSDVEQVKALIVDELRRHSLTLEEPTPQVRLSKHGESALEFTARVWCNAEDYWTVYFDITERIKQVFDENGITIPYSQVDVHICK